MIKTTNEIESKEFNSCEYKDVYDNLTKEVGPEPWYLVNEEILTYDDAQMSLSDGEPDYWEQIIDEFEISCETAMELFIQRRDS